MRSTRHRSLASRVLRLAGMRIALVCFLAGAVSYRVNHASLEQAVRTQLSLSAEQALQREALPFREVKDLERNFLSEFHRIDSIPEARRSLVRDFETLFYRHPDGSYTQRPGLFEGGPLPDGRRFPGMSATYAPDVPPDDDVKARFALSFLLSYQYGSATKGRLFNFYGVVPEKGFPIYQAADIAKVFGYDGPDALRLETYEFYSRGFTETRSEAIFTRIYWDPSNAAWMTTIATPDAADAAGRHRIMACVDLLLDGLMKRTAKPVLPGARSTIFAGDTDGTLIFDGNYSAAITRSEGHASITSLRLAGYRPLLDASRRLAGGAVALVESDNEIVAVGRIPETPWILAVHYPKSLLRSAILTNLGIVVAVGVLTLLVEIFILRSVLQKQVVEPLKRLMRATERIGHRGVDFDGDELPTRSNDEIAALARDFANMAARVRDTRDALEERVSARTSELEQLNRKLLEVSMTDEMTGVGNRRRFDQALASGLARLERAGGLLMLAMIDVDWFKHYNDRYGHPAGDACLHRVAGILAKNIRREHDVVTRYGGEEFAILAQISEGDDALAIGQALCAAMEEAAIEHALSPFRHVTLSIGMAVAAPGDLKDPEGLLLQADRALYRAKQEGRNRVAMADLSPGLTGPTAA